MKKIAVPTRGAQIDDHFGHCEQYTLYTIDANNKIAAVEQLPSPQGCGCKSNIASVLKEAGVTIMVAGSMGTGALNKLADHGIEVLRGHSGDAQAKVEEYLAGQLQDSGEGCSHHGEGEEHECHNHNT